MAGTFLGIEDRTPSKIKIPVLVRLHSRRRREMKNNKYNK